MGSWYRVCGLGLGGSMGVDYMGIISGLYSLVPYYGVFVCHAAHRNSSISQSKPDTLYVYSV